MATKTTTQKDVQASGLLGRLATPSLTAKAQEAVTADIKNQITAAQLQIRQTMDKATLMTGKYGLTGGEAATMQAGIQAASKVKLSALEGELQLKSQGTLSNLIKNPQLQSRDNATAVQSFVAMLNDGLEAGTIQKPGDISDSTKAAFVKQGFRKESLDDIISSVFNEDGTIDRDFWNAFRSPYAQSGAKTTNKK